MMFRPKTRFVLFCLLLLGWASVSLVMGAEAAPVAEEKKDVPVRYRNRPRSQAWFEIQYAFFRDNIALNRAGEALDIQRLRLGLEEVSGEGGLRWGGLVIPIEYSRTERVYSVEYARSEVKCGILRCKVFNIIDEDEMLVWQSRTQLLHVRGVPTATFVDWEAPRLPVGGKSLLPIVIMEGRYKYIDAEGVRHQVRSCEIAKPLTRKQFRSVLESGFELVKWERGKRICPVCKGKGKVKGRHGACGACHGKKRLYGWLKKPIR